MRLGDQVSVNLLTAVTPSEKRKRSAYTYCFDPTLTILGFLSSNVELF